MRARLPAVIVALLLLTAGCSMLPGGQPPSDERAVDARAKAVSALDSVSTYRFAVDGTVRATDGERTRTVGVRGEGAVDTRRRLLASNTTADETTRSQYFDGYTRYTECTPPWNGWAVENVSVETAWRNLTPLGRNVLLLERSNVYWRGTETRDGNRTAVVVAHPSKKTLTSLPDGGQRTGTDLSRANVENITFTMWIDTGTGRPVESELEAQLSAGGASAEMEMTVRYADYGEPVNVSVPTPTERERYELGCPGA